MMDRDQHLSPAGSDTALRERMVSSGAIRITAHAVQFALGIGSTMIMARLLTPADFGLFAMAGSLTAFIGSFRDFGLPMATVHQEKLDHEQMSSLFWLNLRLNLLVAIFAVLMAPVLAWFYGDTRLITIILAMTVGIFCIGLSIQHESLLTRRMRFKALTFIDIFSALSGICVGLTFAMLGAGYWALVLQFLTAVLARSILTWLIGQWRPAGSGRHIVMGSRSNLSPILTYGFHVTASRVLAHIGRHIDRVVVGYVGGATALGLYDRSYHWSVMPTTLVHGPLLGVTVAGLSRVRHDEVRYRDYCRGGLLPVFAISMPIVAFMFIEAPDVLLLLLGSQWLEAVPLFQILCIAAFVGTVTAATKPLYLSLGTTKRQLQWGLLSAPLMMIAVLIGSRWGAFGVAVGVTLATCLLAYPSVVFCLRSSPLSGRDFLGIVWRPAVASVGAALILLVGDRLVGPETSLAARVTIKCLLFGSAYLVAWGALPGGQAAVRDTGRRVSEQWLRATRRGRSDPRPAQAGPPDLPAPSARSAPLTNALRCLRLLWRDVS